MRKLTRLLSLLLLALWSAPSFDSTTAQVVITGAFTTPSGAPFNGKATFYLPFPGVKNTADPACPNACPMVFQGPVSFPIVNGRLLANAQKGTLAQLVGNGDISPGLTYYEVRLYDATNFYSQGFYVYIPSVTAGASFDIGSAVQTAITTTNLSFPSVVGGINPIGTPDQINITGNQIGLASPTIFPSSIFVPNTGTFGTAAGSLSTIGLIPDNFCPYYFAQPYDQLCDLNGGLVWNHRGVGGYNSIVLTYKQPFVQPDHTFVAWSNAAGDWVVGGDAAALSFSGLSTNTATTGNFRCADADPCLTWRNHTNSVDISLTKDSSDNLSYPNGMSLQSLNIHGNGAGMNSYVQGAVLPATNNAWNISGPISVTGAPIDLLPPLAGQGVSNRTLSGSTMTQGISGDSNHSTTVTISSNTSISATQLCSNVICPVGTYEVDIYIDLTATCATGGTYIAWLGYTDDSGARTGSSTTTFFPLQGTGATTATGSLALNAAANYGQARFTLRTTGANPVNYGTTATACGTGGPAAGKMYLAIYPVQ